MSLFFIPRCYFAQTDRQDNGRVGNRHKYENKRVGCNPGERCFTAVSVYFKKWCPTKDSHYDMQHVPFLCFHWLVSLSCVVNIVWSCCLTYTSWEPLFCNRPPAGDNALFSNCVCGGRQKNKIVDCAKALGWDDSGTIHLWAPWEKQNDLLPMPLVS